MEKQDGGRISKYFIYSIRKKRNKRPSVGGVSIRSRNGAPSRKGCVVNGQMTKASNKLVPPPPPRVKWPKKWRENVVLFPGNEFFVRDEVPPTSCSPRGRNFIEKTLCARPRGRRQEDIAVVCLGDTRRCLFFPNVPRREVCALAGCVVTNGVRQENVSFG